MFPVKGLFRSLAMPLFEQLFWFYKKYMDLVRLKIKGISYSQTQNGAYALILNEEEGDRKLPIVIGAFEAQSIAIAMEKEITPPRPLTHDLFKNFADIFQITVKRVVIHKLVDGVFYSSIFCENEVAEEVIDARTSDAIALALRFNAPIFTYKTILDKAGIFLNFSSKEKEEGEAIAVDEILQDEEPVEVGSETLSAYAEFSLDELRKELERAVASEDYEKAAKLRDEISKRKQ